MVPLSQFWLSRALRGHELQLFGQLLRRPLCWEGHRVADGKKLAVGGCWLRREILALRDGWSSVGLNT